MQNTVRASITSGNNSYLRKRFTSCELNCIKSKADTLPLIPLVPYGYGLTGHVAYLTAIINVPKLSSANLKGRKYFHRKLFESDDNI
jgi:hypothetical protein